MPAFRIKKNQPNENEKKKRQALTILVFFAAALLLGSVRQSVVLLLALLTACRGVSHSLSGECVRVLFLPRLLLHEYHKRGKV